MNVYKESNVFQTFSAEHCLEQGYYSKYVEEIQVLTGLTEPIFSDVYQPLLKTMKPDFYDQCGVIIF